MLAQKQFHHFGIFNDENALLQKSAQKITLFFPLLGGGVPDSVDLSSRVNRLFIILNLGPKYPDFCSGQLYSLSRKTSFMLAEAAVDFPPHCRGLEDTYLTGF